MMNTYKFKLFAALWGLFLAFTACQPEEYSLGKIYSKDQLKYSITQNADDPNMIYLESQTPGASPLWITPMGRSTRLKDTVLIPFAGDYQFIYGVESAGGFVQADTVKLNITTTNLNYVNDILWTYLTGGVGNEKSWVADNGKYGLTKGAMYYANPTTTVEWNNFIVNWDPAGNANGSSDADMGWGSTMTFSLEGGAFMTTNKLNEGGIEESGTFFLNAGTHTLSTTDATILRADNYIANADNWNNNLKVLTLTENQLQIAVMRTNSEGPWWFIWNYVSKEYADNYVFAEPEPTLPDGWEETVTTVVSRKIKWVLSPETPFNWCNLDGSFKNAWNSAADYPDWTGFNASVPANYENFYLTMDAEDNSVVFVSPDGTTENGTYILDEKGIYTFDGVKPSFNICSWVNLSTTDENQWRIMKIDKDLTGAMSGMWVGSRDPSNPQYMAFHLIPQFAGGGSSEPKGTEIAFENSKLAIGDIEENENLRLELYNEYGSTKADPGINTSDLVFSNRIDVTFTISGATLKDGAAGSYNTSIFYADPDWSPSGNGDVITVTGDGTYTVSYTPGSNVDGVLVFVVDIVGIAADLADLSAVTATIDKIVMY